MTNDTLNSGIYRILNTQNGKIYIGQAQHFRTRWTEHVYRLNKRTHRNRYLQNAWSKDGADAFVFEILEYCVVELLNEREQIYLDLHMPTGRCYNIAKVAEAPTRGVKFGEESIKRMREAQKNQPPASEATKRKISNANKGKVPSAEARLKMSNAQKKRQPITDETREKLKKAMTGRTFSEETLRNMSIAAHNRSEEHKRKIKEAANNRSEETRQKQREAALKRPPMSEETKRKISASHIALNARKRTNSE